MLVLRQAVLFREGDQLLDVFIEDSFHILGRGDSSKSFYCVEDLTGTAVVDI